MKKTILICVLALFTVNGFSLNMIKGPDDDPGGSLKINCTNDLSGLLDSIKKEYTSNHPGVDFDITIINETEAQGMNLSDMYLHRNGAAYSGKESWSITVGRDILVPVININNPFIEDIYNTGIKPSFLAGLLEDGRNCTWGEVLGSHSTNGITFYIKESEAAMAGFRSFAGIGGDEISSSNIKITADVISDISKDKYAIGFCRLTDIPGSDKHYFSGDIEILPIDHNKNGRLDHYENYQEAYSDLTRAVWIGKYPRSLYSEVKLSGRFVTDDQSVINFIEWILTSGQEQLTAAGFTELIPGEIRSSLNKLYAYEPEVNFEDETYAGAGKAFIWIIGILGMIMLSGLVVLLASKGTVPSELIKEMRSIIDSRKVDVPDGIMFDKSYTWSFMEKDGTVRVGASDFLQHLTGKVSRIIPKHAGESVKRGDPMFTIVQDGKHLVLYSPVSGTVEKVNRRLSDDSSLVNNDPYNEGWIYEIKPVKWMAEYRNFLMGDRYREWLSDEVIRLKEFMNKVIFKHHAPELQPVLQDGGEIVENLLEEMGPDMWEEFQLGFIDKAF